MLGIKGYQAILDVLKTEVPILAIGGITINDVSEIIKTGVHGIAISGEITRNFNSITKFNSILNMPSMHEQVWKVPNKK